MTDVELTFKGEVEALRLQPGDRIIVTLEGDHLRRDWIVQLREQLASQFPDHEVIVLNGLRIAKETSA